MCLHQDEEAETHAERLQRISQQLQGDAVSPPEPDTKVFICSSVAKLTCICLFITLVLQLCFSVRGHFAPPCGDADKVWRWQEPEAERAKAAAKVEAK